MHTRLHVLKRVGEVTNVVVGSKDKDDAVGIKLPDDAGSDLEMVQRKVST
jgi:hypothetical protein